MGEDILVRNKIEKIESRFLGSDDRNTPIDGIGNFSLEGFHDCSFVSQAQQQRDLTTAARLFADDDDDGGDEAAVARDMTAEERRIYYWESQHFLLQEILEQYDSICSKLRQEMKREIEIARELGICNCKRQCTTLCLREQRSISFAARASMHPFVYPIGRPLTMLLQHTSNYHYACIYAGWHEYIEVRVNAQGKTKKQMVLFVVEVGFRDEFRMAKASEEYKKLINQLPQIYIGKWEQMKAIIRLLCEAAKKSAEEQRIHIGPWRKKSFMQMKWSPSSSPSHHQDTRFSRCVSSRAGTSSSSNQERPTAAASSFHLPLPTTLKVA